MNRGSFIVGARSRFALIVCLTVLVLSALTSFFPHGHSAATPPAPERSVRTHAPTSVSCLESVHRHETGTTCAICVFQRVASQGQIRHAPQLAPDLSMVRATLPRRAARTDRVPGSPASRAPPLV